MAGELVLARPMLVADELKSEGEQRGLLKSYVHGQMVEGVDYGVIPGTKNKTLLKPGAEKLTVLFKCTPVFELAEKIEDWDRGLFYYMFRCKILYRGTGDVIAEGFGSANSREGKWRWRAAERACPECGKAAIIKGKAEYGGGWLCFKKKKDGCGAKFAEADPAITSQAGKVENDDVFTLVNTILKIAKKRALVDGAIALARCSDMFTQDAEDFVEDVPDAEFTPARPKAEAPKPAPARPDKAAFLALMGRKGQTWEVVLRAFDRHYQAGYLDGKATYEQVDAAHLAKHFEWLGKQPDAPKPAAPPASDPAPDAEASPPKAGKAILDQLTQAAFAAGFDYVEAAVEVHHKALGVAADCPVEELPAAKAAVLLGILRQQAGRGQPVGAA